MRFQRRAGVARHGARFLTVILAGMVGIAFAQEPGMIDGLQGELSDVLFETFGQTRTAALGTTPFAPAVPVTQSIIVPDLIGPVDTVLLD